jgi:Mrp family chromosome partitioning ATPase
MIAEEGVRDTGRWVGTHDEQRMDVARSMAAIRRGAWLIALIVIPLTGIVLALSLTLPKTYKASATLMLDQPADALVAPSADSETRTLATIRKLLVSRDVLAAAAARLPGETLDTLRDKVDVSVDAAANLVTVTATDDDAGEAAAIANRVSASFLERRRASDRQRQTQARNDIEAALARARNGRASAEEIRALRQRLSQLTVSEATATDELQLAQGALPPERPDSPRPLQNTVFALLASLFLAVLAALAWDRIAPRVRDERELAALSGVSPLVVLPEHRRRRRARTHEALEALAASVKVQLHESQRVIMVTGADSDDDRAEIAVGLGRALAAAGRPTLVVSADLRHGGLHRALGVPRAPGLSDVLVAIDREGEESASRQVRAATRASEPPARGELRALPSGEPSAQTTTLLAGDGLGLVFGELERSEYRYIVVEGPALLGPIDGQLVAQWADAILVVCRTARLRPADARELGDVLGRLAAPVLGSVVIGGARTRSSLPAWTPRREPASLPPG